MADKRISQLVDRGTVANNDVVPIVVNGAVTTNKATISSIQTFMQGNLDLGVTSVGFTLTQTDGQQISVTGSPITTSGNITLNLPRATDSIRGLLDSEDFINFSNKQSTITLTTTGTSGAATLVNSTLNIPNYAQDLSGFVTLGTAQTITAQKTITTNGSSDTLIVNHTSGSGIGVNITKGGNGEGLIVNKTGGSGNAATITGTLQATTIVRTGGTSSQFLKADGSTDSNVFYLASNPSAFITLTSLSQGTGISYNSTTGVIASTITQYTDALARAAISLTVSGASGASTYNNSTGVLNVPTYTLSGLGGVPTTRTLTINGTALDLSVDRTFNVGTVTSVAATAGTGISISGSPITSSGTLSITNTAPDQVVGLTASTGISVSGSYPNFTITNTSPSSGGTVTSVGLSSSTSGVTIGSSPVTTSGTITLAIATASGSQNGLLSSTDFTTFNNKQNALTNPVTGTGTTNFLPKFTGASTVGNSIISESGSVISVSGSVTTDFVVVGTTAASSGGIRLGTQVAIRARNVANTANIPLIESTASDGVSVSNGALILASTGAATFSSSVAGGGGTPADGSKTFRSFDNGSFITAFGNTANAAAIFAGTGSTSVADFINNGNVRINYGNLLVGTTSDNGARLQVSGTATFSSSVTAKGISVIGASGGFTTGDNTFINLGGALTADTFGAINAPFGDKIKFNSFHGFEFKTSNSGGSPITMMTIDIAGNVGIGTNTPGHKLDVDGAIRTGSPTGSSAQPFKVGSVTTTTDSFFGTILKMEINGVVHNIMIAEPPS